MVSIQGIGGIPEPSESRQSQGRAKAQASPPPGQAEDGVEISAEAAQASRAAQVVAQTSNEPAVREERIAQAKENIEQGVYRIQEVVLQVASRLSRYVY